MTDSILDRLKVALEYSENLLKYSHSDVKFEKAGGITDLALSDWKRDYYYVKRNLQKMPLLQKAGLVEKAPSLSDKLKRKNTVVIQPPVAKGSYEDGYFMSPEIKETMQVPAFAVVEKGNGGEKRVIVCVSGSISKDEADLAMNSQAEIVTAVMPFLTACVDYAGENELEIIFTGYSRGSMVILSASDALVKRCREKNVAVDFYPVAPLPVEQKINNRNVITWGLGSDIANGSKNLLSGDWPKYPGVVINNQDYNEKYEGGWNYEKLYNYASNASTYLNNHGLDNYIKTFKELTTNSFYQSVLGQIESQPCKIHYTKESGSYSKNLGKVTLQADESRLNVIMPSFFTKVVSGSGEAEIYCYDNPEKIDRVEFSEEDKVFIVVEGRRNDYTLNRLNHSSGVMLTSDTTKGGVYQNVDSIVYKDGILQLDPIKFSSFSEDTKDRLSCCHKAFASSLKKQSSTGILVASKH